jgi:hypothetical protein
MKHEDWGEPPPFWFVRLSFAESREKDKGKSQKGSNRGATLLSLTLYMVVSLVMLATLDATVRGADISGDHTALGIFFRFQVVEFDIRFLFLVLLVLHVCYLSFVGLFVDCVLSVRPNSN